MKKITLIIAIGLLSIISFGQHKMEVKERSANIADGNHNSFVVVIFEANEKLVEKDWKKELKGMGAKVSSKKEIFGDDATLGSMGANSFDIYAIIKEVKDGIELTVSVDLGGAFLSSGEHKSQAKVIEDLIYEFAVKTSKEAIGEMLEEAEKVLKNFNKEQENLVKEKGKLENEITDNEKNIEQAKQNIEQAKQNIQVNGKDQEKKKQEIVAQEKVVKDIAAKEAAVN